MGSILLKIRDFNTALGHALDEYHIRPFDNATGSAALLNILGPDHNEPNEKEAQVIVSTLGGLPLARSQIGAFIAHAQRKFRAIARFPTVVRTKCPENRFQKDSYF